MATRTSLDCYKSISATTSQMLAAAQVEDWDLLIELEKDCAKYTEALKAAEIVRPVGEAFIDLKVSYIKQILEDDRQIRSLVSPWMKKLEQMMSFNRVEKKLSDKYNQ